MISERVEARKIDPAVAGQDMLDKPSRGKAGSGKAIQDDQRPIAAALHTACRAGRSAVEFVRL